MAAADEEARSNAEKGVKGQEETELCPLVEPQVGAEPKSPSVLGRRQDMVRSNSGANDLEAAAKKTSDVGVVKEVDKSFVNMKVVALISLTVVQTIGPLQTAWTRRQNIATGGPRYLNSSIILFGECTKVIAAFVLLTTEEGGVMNAARSVKRQLTGNMLDNLKICVPALLYAVQGNLLYYSMDKLSPPVFTVSYQLKILTTALLSVILLGKKIGAIKWAALVLLTVGVSLVQLQDSGKGSGPQPSLLGGTTTPPPASEGMSSDSVKGFIAVLAACCTSGLAGVSLEKMLTQTTASIWMRNVQLGLVGMVMASMTAFTKDFTHIIESGISQGYTHREVLLVMTHALGGLCSAAVLKYAGNILKCFAAAISVVLVSCIAVFMSSFLPDPLFAGGVSLVIAAVFLYNVGLPTAVENLWSNGLSGFKELVPPPMPSAKHTS